MKTSQCFPLCLSNHEEGCFVPEEGIACVHNAQALPKQYTKCTPPRYHTHKTALGKKLCVVCISVCVWARECEKTYISLLQNKCKILLALLWLGFPTEFVVSQTNNTYWLFVLLVWKRRRERERGSGSQKDGGKEKSANVGAYCSSKKTLIIIMDKVNSCKSPTI